MKPLFYHMGVGKNVGRFPSHPIVNCAGPSRRIKAPVILIVHFLLDQFYHVTVVYSGYDMEIYMDGVLDTFRSQTGAILTTTKALAMGQKDVSDTKYFLNGTLDEVR